MPRTTSATATRFTRRCEGSLRGGAVGCRAGRSLPPSSAGGVLSRAPQICVLAKHERWDVLSCTILLIDMNALVLGQAARLPAVHPHVHSQAADREKALPHVEHLYGRSPLCTRMCTARWPDCEKALPHVEHLYGRSPLCTRMCTARWPDCEKALPHVEHLYGRSPLCIRICTARVLDCEKAMPHVEHLYGRSPLCTRMCATRLPETEKALPHVEHL